MVEEEGSDMAKTTRSKSEKVKATAIKTRDAAIAAIPAGKISVDELMRKAANPRTSQASLRKYFILDEAESDAFAPQLKINPATVHIPPTPEGRARGDMAINFANSTARLRRTLIFNERIADGYDGPVIVSEGDSWFQFPILLDDTIDHLIGRGYAVRSLDAAGDTLDTMIKEKEYLQAIAQTGASVFLFSAGGNDVLGNGALADHLHNFDPARSPADHILPSYQGLLDIAIAGYDKVLRGVEALPGDILMLCHGYDRPIPNKGKWLGKPMEKRGIVDKAFQKRITDELIDRFNARLKTLIMGFTNARFLDMRGKIGTQANRWHDELHPTSNAYKAVADAFEAAIKTAKPKGMAAAPGPVPKPGPKALLVAAKAAKAKPVSTGRKGWSLHVGLNRIDPAHYGSDGALNACVFDAEAMGALAKAGGFDVRATLTDDKGTRDNVIQHIADAAAALQSGDIFLYTYSGHGSQMPDFNSDEKDNLDETWCLFDGMLIDDEAYELWTRFREGVRVLVLLDCCHSGSAIKAAPNSGFGAALFGGPIPAGAVPATARPVVVRRPRLLSPSTARRAVMNNKAFYEKIGKRPFGDGILDLTDDIVTRRPKGNLRCSVRLISGCQDEQLSLDGPQNGRFTEELLAVWQNGRFDGDYSGFHRAIVNGIALDGTDAQTPNHMTIGVHDAAFDKQKPFTI
jgi:hypothetical protein